MGTKLYVGNLSFSVDRATLEQLFAAYGQVVSAELISDRDTGRSKGFGFIEMATDEQAQAAIAALNGQEHDGRTLTVNEARPKDPRTTGPTGVRGGFGGGNRGYGAAGNREPGNRR